MIDLKEARRLIEAMDAVKAVLDGRLEKPGGDNCRFPHCRCNSPWDICERTTTNAEDVRRALNEGWS